MIQSNVLVTCFIIVADVKLLTINDFLFIAKMDNFNLFKVSELKIVCISYKRCTILKILSV